MDIRKIKKLIELLEESGIAEIEIKEGEEAVRISRMPVGAQPPQVTHLAPAPATALAPAVVSEIAAASIFGPRSGASRGIFDLRDPRSFIPWRLSGLLSGYLPTDTRPQARAKLGKKRNKRFDSASQQFF